MVSERDSESSIKLWQDTEDFAPCALFSTTTLLRERDRETRVLILSALTSRPVSLEELLNYPLISLGTDTKSFEFYSEIFTRHGLPYQPDIEAFTADQILPMVEADLGVGFIPEDFLREDSAVCRIRLKEKIPERSVVLIQRKEQPLSVAAKELKRMILEAESNAANERE